MPLRSRGSRLGVDRVDGVDGPACAPRVVALMRHGDALSTAEDPSRPLSVVGRQHVERVASWLGTVEWRFAEVRHSGLLRAQQTAEILAWRLGARIGRTARMDGLCPGDDPERAAGELEADRRAVLVVGHLPLLGRLTSRLLTGDPDRMEIRFTDAGLVLLEPRPGTWKLVGCVCHEMI